MRIAGILLLVSNAASAGAPEWVNHSERQVLGGDIVHWGTGDAATPDVAVFKARHMAIKTLVEECGGVASKDIIPRKQYVGSTESGYRAFALVSIDFSACDDAKVSKKHSQNPEIVEGQKLYQKLVFGNSDQQARALQEVERRIKEDAFERASENESQIQRLKNDVAGLRMDMEKAQEARREPASVQPSAKRRCKAQLQLLMNRITMHAAMFHGNMADPRMGNELGQAYQLKKQCAELE